MSSYRDMQIMILQYDTAGPTDCSEILQETPGKEMTAYIWISELK